MTPQTTLALAVLTMLGLMLAVFIVAGVVLDGITAATSAARHWVLSCYRDAKAIPASKPWGRLKRAALSWA